MIDDAPYLPCARCNWLAPDCTCHPIDVAFWSGQLAASRRVRRQRHLRVEREYLRGKAAA